jgi:hypothetical protein
LQNTRRGRSKLFKNCKKNQEEDDDVQVWGGVGFPNILASNEKKKKIVRIMKLARIKT